MQLTVGCQSTRATPWIAPRRHCGPPTIAPVRGERPDVDPRSRKRVSTPYLTPALLASRPPLAVLRLASSNASAASESTTAGGLEAFSQGSAGAERF